MIKTTNEIIFELRNLLRNDLNSIKKDFKELGYFSMGFGPYSDEEYDKSFREYEERRIILITKEKVIKNIWSKLENIIGKENIDFALDEQEYKIGNIPYIKTNK